MLDQFADADQTDAIAGEGSTACRAPRGFGAAGGAVSPRGPWRCRPPSRLRMHHQLRHRHPRPGWWLEVEASR